MRSSSWSPERPLTGGGEPSLVGVELSTFLAPMAKVTPQILYLAVAVEGFEGGVDAFFVAR
jgi:hypothetical protein